MEEINKNQFGYQLVAILGVISCTFLSLFTFSSTASADTVLMHSASIANMNFAANNEFIYNPRSLQWKAINKNGKVVRTGRGSGGRSYCPDIHRSCHTPTGTFHVMSKGNAGCRSSRYPVGKGGAAMPYCMFFSKYYAIHGSNDLPHRNASHGCIRVSPSDAHWLHENFINIGTTVVVKPY